MNKNDFIQSLIQLEHRLNSDAFEQFIQSRSNPDLQDQLVDYRLEVVAIRIRAENEQLDGLLQRLHALEPALRQESGDLDKTLNNLNRADTVIKALSDFLGVAARVVLLAAAV